MAVIVQKYGGTSVGDADRIRAVAKRVARTRLAGNDVVVVVSAMGHTTDQFIELSRQVSPNEHPRAMDMLLTAGERISMALLAMAIRDQGVEAVSLTGSQAGIITNMVHGRAEIEEVRAFRVKDHLDKGHVVIVAGFQGVSAADKEITTLGRGGSDATAVAMAAYLHADACEVYTDVDGVFTADPKVVPEARRLAEVSFEEMAQLAGAGAQVLMLRSVMLGNRLGVPLHVRSSFHDGEGTWVRPVVSKGLGLVGVAHDAACVLDLPGDPAALAEALRSALEATDLPFHGPWSHPKGVSVAIVGEQAGAAREVVERVAAQLGAGPVGVREDLGMATVVGSALRTRPELADRAQEILVEGGIEASWSEKAPEAIRVSFLVPAGRLEDAVRLLHRGLFPAPPEEAP